MGLSKKPYKGTRDFFPSTMRLREFLFDKMKTTAYSYGFEPYDGPLLEEVELYRAKSGEELINDQIYSFTDRGEREVAIRPEMTPTVARMVAQIHKEVARPIRWFSIPNLMRYEKPQKGRLREHWQFNCDIFGAQEGYGELEILQVIISLLESFGAHSDHFEILINDRRIIDFIFKNLMKINDDTAYKLYKIIDKSTKVSKEAFDEMLSKLNLDDSQKLILNDYLKISSFGDILFYLNKNGANEISNRLKKFADHLENLKIIHFFKYSPTIVRGLDYYTGMVFEVFDKHPDNRRALCGGGAYNDLMKIFGESPLPGVGFGLGDVTLKDFLESHKLIQNFDLPVNDVYMTFQDEALLDQVLGISNELRKKGIKIVQAFEPQKMNKIFSLAEKKGASVVGFTSPNQVNFKNMKTREQIDINLPINKSHIDEIFKFIRESL